MSDNWRCAHVDELADIEMGQSPPGATVNAVTDGMPLLNGPTEFGLHHPEPAQWTTDPRKRAYAGDLLFCVRGSTTGRMNWADRDYAIGRGVAALRHKAGGEFQPFVRGLIEHHLPELLAGATGSTFPNVSRTQLAQLKVRVPPPDVQRRIARILGTLDDKIELNRRMNRTLEAIARGIFKSWFVDFDPVHAKAEGREPVGVDPETAALFPDSFQDSPLGKIPKGWEVGTLAGFSSLNPEAWSKETRPAVINYVDLSNTKWGRIETVVTHARQDAPSRAQRVLRPRDTVVGTVRPGNGSYAFIAEHGLTGSTGFAVLRPLSVEYAEFVFFAATAAENVAALSRLADGGAYPAVRPEVVVATQVVTSGDDVIKGFSRLSGPLLAKMAENERESRILAALRDALLPELISGVLRVEDVKQFRGDVV